MGSGMLSREVRASFLPLTALVFLYVRLEEERWSVCVSS